ncbi:MAG: alpha/beta hydrolase [Candidatus Limnocylindrales bacterium]
MRRSAALLLALSLVLAPAAAGAQDEGYRTVEEPLYGVTSQVPEGWQDLGGGSYARGTPPADLALIAIQSAPATIDRLWASLVPQFGLSDVPDVSGAYEGGTYDWTLHRFEVTAGGVTVAVDLALSENDGTTSLVLLQADPEELDELGDQVLFPALDAFAPLAPEPTPDAADFDYSSEEVAFAGGSEDVELAGTLTLPNTAGPHPVVITMTGSGPQDRNESLRPLTLLEPFAVIADALTSAGVGVLRYDDRGVGGSTGDYSAATVQELAEDARAAIDYLETRDDVDPDRIGLFGHSEGGLYAAILGASDPRVAFIGMMAPAVIDGIDLIVEQNMALTRSAGSPEEQVQAAGEYTAEVMPLVLEGDLDAARDVSTTFYGSLWDELTPEEQAFAGEREAFIEQQLEAQFPTFESDWYRSLLGYDPGPDWSTVEVPVLAVFGGKDVQVIAESNETALREALAVAGNEDVTTLTIPDANHLFQAAVTGAIGEYQELEPEFIDGFVATVVDWFVERAGVAG